MIRGRPVRAFRWWIGGVCGAGLALRLFYGLVVRAGAPLLGDALYYHKQAIWNLRGRWFVDPIIIEARHHPAALVPSAQHPPLFTLVLTLGDVLGLRSTTSQVVLNCLIGTATIAVTALVARDLAGERSGVIAAVVAALYPGFWVFDGEVMSEALVMLLAALTILAAVRCFRDCTRGRVALLGLLTGLCALTRTELVLLVPLVGIPTVLWQHRMAWRRRIVLSFLVVGVAAATMAPWVARNLTTFHHPVWLSDQLPATLASANNPPTYYGPLTASWCINCLDDTTFPRGDDESDEGVVWDAQAKAYIEAHKGRAVVVAVDRVGLVWGVYAPVRQANQDFLEGWPTPVSFAWMYWYYPLAVLGVAGAVILRRRREPIYPLVAQVVVVTVAEAEVAIVIGAAVALDALWRALEGRRGVDGSEPGPETETEPGPEPGPDTEADTDTDTDTDTDADAEPVVVGVAGDRVPAAGVPAGVGASS